MINKIQPINNQLFSTIEKTTEPKNTNIKFENVLKDALQQVEKDVKQSNELTNQLITGDVQDVHQVMLQLEKANMGLQLTVQVRNKVVEAYQEIMRMQV